MKTRCPYCGHQNRTGVLVCERCDLSLNSEMMNQVTTRKLDDIPHRSRRNTSVSVMSLPPEQRPVIVYIAHHELPMAIDRDGIKLIGRQDDSNGVQVDIDLTPYQAQEHGVSRRHLLLDCSAHPPTATDVSSVGTFINGMRLAPNQAYMLRSGDELRLGNLPLRIYLD